jgi:hypothetical protein
LANDDTLDTLIRLLSRYSFIGASEWLEIGTFGESPATIYLSKDAIAFIVDGKECGDGSSESFGIHLAPSHRDELISLLQAEYKCDGHKPPLH